MAWAEEVELRSQAVETGRAKSIPRESVFVKIISPKITIITLT